MNKLGPEPVEEARLEPAPDAQNPQAWLAEFEAAKAEFAERVQACLPAAKLRDPLITVGDINETLFSITVNRSEGTIPLLFIHPDRASSPIEAGLKESDFKGLHLSGDEAWLLAKAIVMNLAGHGSQQEMIERLERLREEVRRG